MNGMLAFHGDGDRPVDVPRIVDGGNRHLARVRGMVDNANHAFAQRIGGRGQQRQGVGVGRYTN